MSLSQIAIIFKPLWFYIPFSNEQTYIECQNSFFTRNKQFTLTLENKRPPAVADDPKSLKGHNCLEIKQQSENFWIGLVWVKKLCLLLLFAMSNDHNHTITAY